MSGGRRVSGRAKISRVLNRDSNGAGRIDVRCSWLVEPGGEEAPVTMEGLLLQAEPLRKENAITFQSRYAMRFPLVVSEYYSLVSSGKKNRPHYNALKWARPLVGDEGRTRF